MRKTRSVGSFADTGRNAVCNAVVRRKGGDCMIPFVDCNEAVFRGTLILLLLAAFVGVVCFAISLSYRLKLRYILPELLCTVCAILMFCFLVEGIRIRDFGEN